MASLVSWALVTLNETKEAMSVSGTADDARLSGYINRATDIIESYCGRRFIRTTFTEEIYDGNGTYGLTLRNYPVVTFSSLQAASGSVGSYSWESIDTDNYDLRTSGAQDRGMIFSEIGFVQGIGNYRVTYTAGYLQADLPNDLREACIEIVSYLYGRSKATPGMKSETLGHYSYTLETPVGGMGIIKRLGLDEILGFYRTVVV